MRSAERRAGRLYHPAVPERNHEEADIAEHRKRDAADDRKHDAAPPADPVEVGQPSAPEQHREERHADPDRAVEGDVGEAEAMVDPVLGGDHPEGPEQHGGDAAGEPEREGRQFGGYGHQGLSAVVPAKAGTRYPAEPSICRDTVAQSSFEAKRVVTGSPPSRGRPERARATSKKRNPASFGRRGSRPFECCRFQSRGPVATPAGHVETHAP